LAIAMKIYPGAFVLLLFSRRKYKLAAFAVALAVLLNVIPAVLYDRGWGMLLWLLKDNFENFKQEYILRDCGMRFSCSYFTVLKFIAYLWSPEHAPIKSLLFPYFIACLSGYALIAAYVYFVEKTLWKQVALLTMALLLF